MSTQRRERVIADPEANFPDPQTVVADVKLSDAEKIKILLNWRQDLVELQTATTENMPDPAGDSKVAARLQAVTNALIALGHESD